MMMIGVRSADCALPLLYSWSAQSLLTTYMHVIRAPSQEGSTPGELILCACTLSLASGVNHHYSLRCMYVKCMQRYVHTHHALFDVKVLL